MSHLTEKDYADAVAKCPRHGGPMFNDGAPCHCPSGPPPQPEKGHTRCLGTDCPECGAARRHYRAFGCLVPYCADDHDAVDRLARALAKADGKVWWTEAFPAVYRDQAAALLADGWLVTPPGEKS